MSTAINPEDVLSKMARGSDTLGQEYPRTLVN